MVSLPSFAQKGGNVAIDHTVVIGRPIDNTWAGWGNPNDPGNGNGVECDTVCTAQDQLLLRNQRRGIAGCYGEPRNDTFDALAWYENETSFWNQLFDLTFSGSMLGFGWRDDFYEPINWLANELDITNGDLYASRLPFSAMLVQTCYGDDDFDECIGSIEMLLESYMPRDNWFFGWLNNEYNFNLPSRDYDATWGGRLARDVDNYRLCKLVYQSWNEQNCDGSL